MDTNKFIQGTVGIVVAIIVVVAVGIPIITANQIASTVSNYSVMNTILNILPVFLLIAVLVSAVAIMKAKKND